MGGLLRRLRGRASSSKLAERLQQPSRIERVAFLGPVPPTATGIATYDQAVLDGLARIGFTRDLPVDVVWPVDEHRAAYVPAYRLGVYQLGNNVEFHLQVYRTAWQAPGLVVLHDLALDDFVRGLQSVSDPLGYVAVREALQARDQLRSSEARRNEPLRTPWAAAIARRSRGIVVHSQFCRRYLQEFGCKTPIYVVPHPPVESVEAIEGSAARGRALRAKAESQGASALVVAVGDMNEAKRLDVVLRAAALLDPDVHVALVGRKVPTFDVWPLVHASGLGERLHVEQDVSDQDFLGWLHAADVVVDLRFPHRGEVSGSLARAMQVGRPTVLSATGTYLDVPDGSALHVGSGPGDPDELAERLRTLLEDPDLRRTMGATAKAYMDGLRTSEATAHGYADAISQTIAIVEDPTATALARWARSLADLGVTQEYLDAGYGVRYARALEDFKTSS
jgi:glycosyltransferase involved in cell wall biosynthesis